MLKRLNQPVFFSWLLLMTITAAIFLPVLLHWRSTGDFEPHTEYILRMMNGEAGIFNEVPNFLYHLLVVGMMWLLPGIALDSAIVLVCLALYGCLATGFFWLVRGILVPQTWRGEAVVIWLAVTLMLITPVFLLTPNNAYFGYLTPYVYHNPTMMPLRPISLAVFVAAAEVYTPLPAKRGGGGATVMRILAVAGLTLASIFSKPAFVMILLPALAVMTPLQMLRRRPVDWWMLIFGIGIPAVGLLGYQGLTYTEGGIAWYPLRTFDLWALHYDPAANTQLPLKLVMSLLFPLVVYVLYFPRARRDILFNLAWLCFAAGAAYTYLLIDTGEPPAGNLTWNGQAGIFVLYTGAMLFWLRYLTENRAASLSDWRFGVCTGVFGLHLVSGLLWYGIHLNAVWPDVIYTAW